MDTNNLIKTLVADARRPIWSLSTVWRGALGVAVVAAAAIFFATLGPRPDIVVAAQTPRFLFKFVVTISLTASAFPLVCALSRPGAAWGWAMPYLAIAPALIALAAIVELILLPQDAWLATTIGANSMICLTYIPLIGVGPLAIFLLVLRHGAPTRPALAGAAAGALAGGIAATFYATQCTDDSPLFVATWYTIAIAGLCVLGAASATKIARW